MKKVIEYLRYSWQYLLFYAMLIILGVCMTSCNTTKYVPLESVRTDSIYISQVKWDSVYVQDSVHIHERGETIFVDKVRYKYVEHYSHDTVYSEKIDSVRVPYPVERKIEKWESFWIVTGKVALSIVIVVVFIVVGCFLYKIFR